MEPNQPTSKEAVNQAPVNTAANDQPRNFLVAFLLTIMFGQLGLRHFYTGEKKLGWIRLGLVVGGFLWTFIFALADAQGLSALGPVAVAVAGIWAIVDFFAVYLTVRKDADGHDLVMTERDKVWAKAIFWTIIAAFVLWVVSFISIMSFVINSFNSTISTF